MADDGELTDFTQAGTKTGLDKLNKLVAAVRVLQKDVAELKKGKSSKIFHLCDEGEEASYLIECIKLDGATET